MAADKKTERKYTSLTQFWSQNKTNGPDCHHYYKLFVNKKKFRDYPVDLSLQQSIGGLLIFPIR